VSLSCDGKDETVSFQVLGYAIVSGDDSGSEKFQIGASSGVITTTATALDYETTNSYTLLVDVVDDNSGSQTHTSTATVIVKVCMTEQIETFA
jgi:hypothetical protein